MKTNHLATGFSRPWQRIAMIVAATGLFSSTAMAQLAMPSDFGAVVNGYQEQFDGTTLNSYWVPVLNPAQANIYVLNGKGVLQCHTAIGDPAHLLLEVPGYDLNNHEVLARFRVADFGLGDGPRGGIAVAVMVDPPSQATAIGQGINLHFRNNPENGAVNNHHMNFLDDRRAWQGSVIDNNWSVGTWYWVRVKREITGGSPLTSGKVWPADGTTQEPVDWDITFSETALPPRSGYAGIASGVANERAEFECDYFLLKAAGLPPITVAPTGTPPEITSVTPTNRAAGLQASAVAVGFSTASPFTGINTSDIKVTVNGVDKSSSLQITGTANALQVVLPGPFATNQIFNVSILVTDISGSGSTYDYTFDTMNEADKALYLEGEDYNYSSYDPGTLTLTGSGKFIDNPIPATGPNGDIWTGDSMTTYMDLGAAQGIDMFQVLTNGNHLYRMSAPPTLDTNSAPVGTEVTGDYLRQKYVDNAANDYNVGWFDVGEWLNYTRTFAPGSYLVYARLASGNADNFVATLDEVTGDRTKPNQTTSPLGRFINAGTGGWQNYVLVPLTDALGNKVVAKFSAVKTVRFTLLSGGLNFNYLVFVPAASQGSTPPIITAAYPQPNATRVALDGPISLTINDKETKVQAGSVSLSLNDVDITAAALVDTAAPLTTVKYTPTAFWPNNATNKVTLVFTDNTTRKFTNVWFFTTLDTNGVVLLPASLAMPVASGQLPGFDVRIVQAPIAPGLSNDIARANAQLAGVLTISNAVVVTEAFGSDMPSVINYNLTTANAGNFTNKTVFPIPGLDPVAGNINNLALEAVAYLQLNRGNYWMGVNSDDGFVVTAGVTPADTNLVLGSANLGKGASDVMFNVLVETNGIYPFRLVYFQGGSAASVEWFTRDPLTDQRTLINAANSTVKAFRVCTNLTGPAISFTQDLQPAITRPANVPATLSIVAASPGITYSYAFMYQWQSNGVNIAGATKPTYVTPNLVMGQTPKYRCVVTVPGYPSANSVETTVTVNQDITPPTVVKAVGSATFDTVTVTFSETVDTASGQNAGNYTLSDGVTVNSATLDSTGTKVILNTSAQTPGAHYTVTVSGVKDLASLPVTANSQVSFTAYAFTQGFVLSEMYLGITGGNVADLTGAAKYINHQPDSVSALFALEAPQTSPGVDNYGRRIYGWLIPPTDGDYTFYIASDDASQVYLSSDESTNNLQYAASQSGAVGYRSFTNTVFQTSAPVTLQAGNRYFVEVLMKEGAGGDYVSVGWTLPGQLVATNNTMVTVIPGQYLYNYLNGDNSSVVISQQPTNATVLQNRSVTFSVSAAGTSDYSTNLTYQWYRDGVKITNATGSTYTIALAQLTDGVKYKSDVTVPGKTVTSSEITLIVNADTAAPTVLAAGAITGEGTNVFVTFDALLDPATAANAANYTVSGVAVTGATLDPNGKDVILTLDQVVASGATVKVQAAKDLAGNAMTSATTLPVVFGQDVTQPTDPIVPTSSNFPAAENAPKAIDNLTNTKYLSFDILNTGFTVTPAVGASILNGITLTSANDAAERDPASFRIEGSNDGTNFTLIAEGLAGTATNRLQRHVYMFPNTLAYTAYRVIFPTIANAAGANSMQVAEVELLGNSAAAPAKLTIGYTASSGKLLLNWTNAGSTLQSTPVLPAVPWTDVPGSAATNKMEVPTTTGNGFYRLKQ